MQSPVNNHGKHTYNSVAEKCFWPYYLSRDQLGRSIQMAIPTATPVTLDYAYTSLGQVDTIKRGAETLVNYSYYGSIVSGRQYPTPGVNFTPTYDSFGRVSTHTTVNGSGGGVNFQYTYDNNGNIISKKFNHRTGTPANVYGYDALNRVTNGSYVYTTGSEQFNYDLLGNRDSVVDTRPGGGTTIYAHNIANEYTTINTTNITHDAAGNLQTDTAGYTHHYDHDNRLVTIKKNNDSDLVADYTYDAMGRRIEKVDAIAAKTTRYYYDDQRVVLEEQTSQGSTAYRWFVYGNYIDEALMYEWQIGEQNTRFYFAHDHLFSPVVMFNNAGIVMERYEYDAYGKVRIMNANYASLNYSLLGNTCFFTGRELDRLDAGNCTLMYYRARYYTPATSEYIDGLTTEYGYKTGTHYLETIKDAKGAQYVSNTYEDGWVTKQTYGEEGCDYEFEYNPWFNEVRLTDRNGFSNIEYYNEYGDVLARIVETDGRRQDDPPYYMTTYSYNNVRQLETVVFPAGNSVQYTYNDSGYASGKVETVTEFPVPGSSEALAGKFLQTKYEYEPTYNFVEKITDTRGYVTSFEYDHRNPMYGTSAGNLMKITYPKVNTPDGEKTPEVKFTYNRFGQVKSITGPDNVKVQYDYCGDAPIAYWKMNDIDPKANTLSVLDSSGNNHTGAPNNDMISITEGKIGGALNFNGSSDGINCRWDGPDLTDKITVSAWVKLDTIGTTQFIAAWNYDTTHRRELYINPQNYFKFLVGSGSGFVVASSESSLLTAQAGQWYHVVGTYDGAHVRVYVNGEEQAAEDLSSMASTGTENMYIGSQKNSQLFMDGAIDEVMIFDRAMSADEVANLYNYFNYGRLVKVTVDPYDPVNNPDGENIQTLYNYDEFGNVRTVTDPTEHSTGFDYNALDQLVQTTSALDYLTKFHYDENKKLDKVQAQLGATFSENTAQTTSFTYNILDKLKIVTDSLGRETESFYDNNDNINAVQDAESKSKPTQDQYFTSMEYDERDLLWKVTDAEGHITEYSYDLNGNLKLIKDNKGQETKYTYDGFGRLDKTIYENDSYEQYGYDDAGNITSYRNRAGQTITFSYDALNRHERLTRPSEADIVLTYNLGGSLVKVAQSTSQITMTHDRIGRVTAVTDQNNKAVGYEYYKDGRRKELTYPDSTFITYHYDAAGRLEYIKDQPGNIIVHYTSDELSRLTNVDYYNNQNWLGGMSYDYEDKVEIDDDLGNRIETIDYAFAVSSPHSISYSYDNVGNATSANGWVYDYDKTYQLTDADNNTSRSIDYSYDAVYNRFSVIDNSSVTNYSANSINQYTAVGAVTPTYDTNGNLTYDGVNVYMYDCQNRLTSVITGSGTITYSYDLLGRRLSRTLNGVVTTYVWDGEHIIAEYDSEGSLIRKYIYGPGIDNPVAMVDCTGESPVWYYYYADALGSVRLITNAAGAVVEGYSYDPFGKPTVNTTAGTDGNWLTPDGSTANVSTIGNRLMFTARDWDSTMQIYYYRFRDYSPQLGRFLQPDPLGYIDNLNLYAYCGNSPINFLDPFGLCKSGPEIEKQEIIKEAEKLVKDDFPYFPYFNDCDNQNDRIANKVMQDREYWNSQLVGKAKSNKGPHRGNHSVTKMTPSAKAIRATGNQNIPKSWVLDIFHAPFGKRDVEVFDWDEWEKMYPYEQAGYLETVMSRIQFGGTPL